MRLDIYKNNRKKTKESGFTLVETLVAVGILSLSILSTFTTVQSGLQNSTTAKDQVTAFYFIQDSMEYIKNKRDENALNAVSGISTAWLSGLAADPSDPCYFGKICRIDSYVGTGPSAVVDCQNDTGNVCQNLRRDMDSESPTFGLVGYDSDWTATNFKREIWFTQNSFDDVLVTIRMSWTSRGVPKTFQVTQLLMNRQ
ncbi:MAG: type II secretion system protein [Parcubacteria group bacterium]